MREIKFRIWIQNRFYYWGFIDGGFAGIPNQNFEIMNMQEIEKRSQQYTGLKDRNGKEIYGGDIVVQMLDEDKVGFMGQVIWSKYDNGWRVLDTLDDEIPINSFNRILGNIYENPELLE